jgi:hypothetical protein
MYEGVRNFTATVGNAMPDAVLCFSMAIEQSGPPRQTLLAHGSSRSIGAVNRFASARSRSQIVGGTFLLPSHFAAWLNFPT